jgi:hypothetical protein
MSWPVLRDRRPRDCGSNTGPSRYDKPGWFYIAVGAIVVGFVVLFLLTQLLNPSKQEDG